MSSVKSLTRLYFEIFKTFNIPQHLLTLSITFIWQMKETSPKMLSKLPKVTSEWAIEAGSELLVQTFKILLCVPSRMPGQRARAFPRNSFRKWDAGSSKGISWPLKQQWHSTQREWAQEVMRATRILSPHLRTVPPHGVCVDAISWRLTSGLYTWLSLPISVN